MSPALAVPDRDRLRIAVQKSGRLAEPARRLLAACGLVWREEAGLFCRGESLPIDLLRVRDDDIPGLIAAGVCDLGVVGRNELQEQVLGAGKGAPRAGEWRALGFGRCRLMLAVPDSWVWTGVQQLAGAAVRIATSYPALLRAWLDGQGIEADVVELAGSVEIAPRLGTADLVCDLVSSGATLAANGLVPVATLLDSEAVLAGPAAALEGPRGQLADLLLRRLDGVLGRKEGRLLMFRARPDAVPALRRLLPPTAPLVQLATGPGSVSLQAMCEGAVSWQQLEALERAGASELMVLAVERCWA